MRWTSAAKPDPDVAALLRPLPGPNPAGRPVRYEGDYDRIGEARRHENAALPQGVWVREIKRADWPLVARLCIDTLTHRSKDLRVACWLIEAWASLDGATGLGKGLALANGLCVDFWDTLYPVVEAGDVGARVAPVEWLNQRLPTVLRLWPVVRDAGKSDEHFTWADYLDAQRLDTVRRQDPAAAQRAEAKGAVTMVKFDACLKATPAPRLEALASGIDQALMQLETLDTTLTARCGRDSPGLGKVRSVAADIAAFARVALLARATRPVVPVVAAPALSAIAAPSAASPPQSRDAAYRQLADIAAFLHKTEPHSPVPPVLLQMVEWGRLPLAELVARLSAGGGDMGLLLQLLGPHVDGD